MKRRRGRPEVPRSMNFQKEKAPCPTSSVFLETSENCGHKVEGIIRDKPGGGGGEGRVLGERRKEIKVLTQVVTEMGDGFLNSE